MDKQKDDSSPTVKLSLEGECSEEGGSGRLNAALRQAVSSGDKEAIRLLLSEGADVNYCDDANSAVIFCAIDGGAVSILDLLISNGANIELRDTHGYTPLMRAAKAGKAGMVESLLAAGANAKARRKGGMETALWLAHERRHYEICTMIADALEDRSI
ncbi:Ankyrin repeat and KH domain-containing protein 1 [Taenia crassiceps]|uniref:Ankyrin repeat and KH domain-containing protein 1 n=1 Tax=Taenia crassiceps TaxID=6207 RepID=A0ABR4Q3Y6_9CEST